MFFSPNFPCQRRTLLSFAAAGLPGITPAAALAVDAPSPGVMLAKPWQASLNPADYLVSEKLDGVRALWDGDRLRFRSGRPIAAPAWMLAGLPGVALDGELWLGRQRFDALSGIVRKQSPLDSEWRSVRYMVFDLPQLSQVEQDLIISRALIDLYNHPVVSENLAFRGGTAFFKPIHSRFC